MIMREKQTTSFKTMCTCFVLIVVTDVMTGTPYGQLPILVYKGKTYGETKALASFLARECGLYRARARVCVCVY